MQEELERRVKTNGLKWFTPNGAQEKFINRIGTGKVFVGISSFANGVGKTGMMASIAGAVTFGPSENPFFDKPFYKEFPYLHRGRIISTTKNVEEIGAIQTEIKKWWPKGKYKAERKGKRYDSEYIIGDWVWDIMTYEQDAEQFESANLGIIIFDEPPPIKILYASIARMRAGGIILIFMTPLDEGGEIIEDLLEKGHIEYEGEVIGEVFVQYADIEENCKEHGIRGHLNHKDIVKMISMYPPEEIEARAHGKPTHLAGRIYPDFTDEEPYVVDDFKIPDEWSRVVMLDPHDAIPYALSWAAIDEVGDIFIYDEFPVEDLEKITNTSLTIPDYARIIREKEGRQEIVLRIIDPFFGNKRYSNTGKSVKQEMAELGLDFVDGDTSGLDIGHQKVREYLKYQKAYPVSGTNHPKFHVLKSCRNHRRSMLRYKRKLLKSGEVRDKMVIDETYKHFCDNVRHLLMTPDLHRLKLNSQDQLSSGYRVVGDLKDVKFDSDDEYSNKSRYLRVTQGG